MIKSFSQPILDMGGYVLYTCNIFYPLVESACNYVCISKTCCLCRYVYAGSVVIFMGNVSGLQGTVKEILSSLICGYVVTYNMCTWNRTYMYTKKIIFHRLLYNVPCDPVTIPIIVRIRSNVSAWDLCRIVQ